MDGGGGAWGLVGSRKLISLLFRDFRRKDKVFFFPSEVTHQYLWHRQHKHHCGVNCFAVVAAAKHPASKNCLAAN